MKVEMIGSISGHAVTAEGEYVTLPQRGDVVEVDDEQGARWIEQGMAKAVAAPESELVVETAAIGTEPGQVETAAPAAASRKR